MDKNFLKIIEEIAEKNGVSVFEVKKEMEIALEAAWNNPDEKAREQQRKTFPNGKPSAEEFFFAVLKKLLDES